MADDSDGTTTPTEATTAATPDWRSSLPDDLRGEKSLESFKDIAGLAKSYIETKRLVGQRQELKVPGAEATPEERAAFHKALGVPDTPDAYPVQWPEAALNGGLEKEAAAAFLADMHKAGTPPAVLQAAVNWYGRYVADKAAAAQREAQATLAELKQEWGPNWEANVGRANRALSKYGGDDLVAFLAQSGLGRHPLMVRAWANVANELVETGALETAGDLAMGPDEARAELAAIDADATHPANNYLHPDHQAALEHKLALRRLLLGSENRKVVTIGG